MLRAGSQDSSFFRVSAADGTFIAGDADLPDARSLRSPRGSNAQYRGQSIRLIGHSAYVGNERINLAIAETTHQRDALRERILLTASRPTSPCSA